MDVWVTDNSSTKRRGQYIAYAATRAADGPDGMEARGRPFSVGGKGLTLVLDLNVGMMFKKSLNVV